MINAIAIVVLVAIIGGSVSYMIKAKKSGVKCIGCPAGGSCSRSGDMPRKKLFGPVIGRKTLEISGIHCDHCVWSVTRELNKIEGASAKVSLKGQKAVVSFDREIDETELIGAVEAAGFQVVSIQP